MKSDYVTLDDLYKIFLYISNESGYTESQVEDYIISKGADLRLQVEHEQYFLDLNKLIDEQDRTNNSSH